jgi:hypothetical protein
MSYENWHFGGTLCEVPNNILIELEEFFAYFTQRTPDQLGDTYKQWYVQTSNINDNIDATFIHWKDENILDNTKRFFSRYVTRICRFRLSLLNEGNEVDYHTKHVLPRIHIPLNKCVSTMVIKDENGYENFLPLEYGKAYFTNVTKLHKVVGDLNNARKNAFFCFTDFVDVDAKLKYCR